jgi:hypothetical protein
MTDLHAVPDPPKTEDLDDAQELEWLVDDIERFIEVRSELWDKTIPEFMDRLISRGMSPIAAAEVIAKAVQDRDADPYGEAGFRDTTKIVEGYEDRG